MILSPAGSSDIRIVLTWGPEPRDLDSHLTGPGFHVYYADRGNTEAPPFAGLDVDDRDGVGPETITITQLNGTYLYVVHDFTNRNSTTSDALAHSSATVAVYDATTGLWETFFVPNQPGNLWTVFELSGSQTRPNIRRIDEMGSVQSPAVAAAGAGHHQSQIAEAELIGRAAREHAKAASR